MVTEYRYVSKIAAAIDNYFLLSNLVDFSFGMASATRAFVFVDDHDMQRANGNKKQRFGEILRHKNDNSN